MQQYSQGSVNYLEDWYKEHGFQGELKVEACDKLVENLKKKAEGKKGKDLNGVKLQMIEACKWQEQAQKRKAKADKRAAEKTQTVAVSVGEVDPADCVASGFRLREELDRLRMAQEAVRRAEKEERERVRMEEMTNKLRKQVETGGVISPMHTRNRILTPQLTLLCR